MNENSYNEKAIYLHTAELLVLLQGQDIRELFVFRELEDMSLSYAQIGQACINLVEKKILVPDGTDVFSMTEDIRKIITVMKKSKSYCTVYGQMMSIPMRILYFYEEDVVALQYDEFRDNYFRLTCMPFSDMVQQLMGYDFLSQRVETREELRPFQEQEDEGEAFVALPKGFREKADMPRLMEEDEDALLYIRFYMGTANRTLLIYRQPLSELLLWKSGNASGYEAYTYENFEKKVKEYSRGIG